LWAYSHPLADQARVWWNDPDYTFAFLVPVFSLALLWSRRDRLRAAVVKGSWWGLALLGLAAAMRCAAAHECTTTLDRLSLVPSLAGAVLFIGGAGVLGWAWPSIVFLVFMVPVPTIVTALASYPLQRLGTVLSVGLLQLLGVPALARGNVIALRASEIGVVEACSGLRMIMLCLALTVGTILIARLSRLEKLLVVLSAVPIAVIVNVARLTGSAIFQELLGPGLGTMTGHDVSGWFAMPLAVVLVSLELMWIAKLRRPRPVEAAFPPGEPAARCTPAIGTPD
jgi:exosortase